MADESPQVSAAPAVARPAPAKPRVLVVDDEELVRLVVAKTLELAGYEVFEARDGADALEVLPTAAPDLVLTDLNMPRLNGERLCVEIKRRPGAAGIRVVIMTGGPLDEARMRELGCAGVIYKPLPDRLPDLIGRFLSDRTPPGAPGLWAVPGVARRSA